MTKEDKRTGRQTGRGGRWGKGELRGGDVPAGALAHVPCCHTKGVPFALASKTGGRGRGIIIIIFFVKEQTIVLANVCG